MPAAARRCSSSAIRDIYHRRRPCAAPARVTSPSDWKASTTSSSTTCARKGLNADKLASAPRGRTDGCWSSSAARRSRSRVARPRALIAALGRSAIQAAHASLRRQRSQAGLGHPRVGPRRHRVRSRQAPHVGRLGRCRRRSRKTRRLPSRPAQLLNEYGYSGALYGHFGQACVHTRNNFDLEIERRHRASSARSRRSRRPLHQLRRLALRRTRRRPGARRTAAEDVRPRTDAGLPRVQTLWDPDWKMNPGKVVEAVSARPRISGSAPTTSHGSRQTHFQFPDDHGASPARPALRRRRQMPAHGRRHDVPQLHGHARRRALHARPRPPALRDVEGARVIRDGGATKQSRTRSISASPAKAARAMPRQRRHGHLQGRIPLPLLRRPPPPAQRLRLRPHRPLGARRVACPRPGEPNNATPRPARHREASRRNPAPTQHPALRPRNLQRLVLPHRPT